MQKDTFCALASNIKAMCLSDFQPDVQAWVEAASQQCSDLDLASLVYIDGLRRVLDRHAPSVTRCVRNRPSAPLDDRGGE